MRARIKGKEYVRKPGAGRPPKPARQVFEAVVYALRTSCQWKALPKERFGSASAVHKRFLEWEEAGVFEAIWRAGLAEYDQMEGIAWRWQSIDAAMFKHRWHKRPSVPTRRIGEKKGVYAMYNMALIKASCGIGQSAKRRRSSAVSLNTWSPRALTAIHTIIEP